ncbi:type II secretion system protein [Vitiosangium sp. GDMCC 1.1324]|uniref:type II secretion system protein n=1 Tax=Vitiosangium sp. (strain GDMCC 1.1324) TaxID=2138576 RepID=UPI0011B65FCE|nr:hypothetical protein [Vitiosangium sp. GDMCC 1.1324]
MFARFRNPPSRGLTLIEIAMLLAIAAVVIGGMMTLYLSTSNQRKLTDTEALTVSAVQRISDLYEGKSMRGFDNRTAVALGALPSSYEAADGSGYNLPIANAKMTFGSTNFSPGPDLGIIHVGPLSSEACIALGKLNLGDVVKYVIVNKDADFTGTDKAALATQSIKDINGDISISVISSACADGSSYVHYYLTD